MLYQHKTFKTRKYWFEKWKLIYLLSKKSWKTWKLQLTEKERAAIQCPLCLFLTKGLGHPSSHYNSAWSNTNLGVWALFWVWWGFFVVYLGFFWCFLVMYCMEMPMQYSCLEISGFEHFYAWNIVSASLSVCKVKWSIGSNLT